MSSLSEKLEMNTIASKDAIRLCRDTEDIKTILALTTHVDPIVRQRALKEICPCRVKDDIDQFWERVLEMINDPADNVREQVSISLFKDVNNMDFFKRCYIHYVMVHLIIWK